MAIQIVKRKEKKAVTNKATGKVVTKKKVATKTKYQKNVDALKTLVDKLGEVKSKVAEIKKNPAFAEEEKLSKDFYKIADDTFPEDKKAKVIGKIYNADIGPRGMQTSITNKARVIELLEEVKPGLSLELMKFGITDLRDYLNPEQLLEIFHEDRVTKRKVSVYPIG